MRKEREERGNACASGYKDGICFVVRLGKEIAIRELEPDFGADLKLLLHPPGEFSFDGIGDLYGFLIGIALHRETSGVGPLTRSIVFFI